MEMTTILHSSPTDLPFHTPLTQLSFSTPTHHRISLPSQCLFSSSLWEFSLHQLLSLSHKTNSTTKVATVDPSIALDKKATDISTDLRGTSIFLVEAAGGEAGAISLNESDEKGFRESETEVLKQLLSLGRLVVCAGDGVVQNSKKLALLRHGISIWIDVPLDLVAKGIIGNKSQLLSSEITISGSYSEVLSQLTALYEDVRRGFFLAEVVYQLGYKDVDAASTEDITI